MIPDFEQWRAEVLFTGKIIQDGDMTVPSDEAERRCNRYHELVDMVEGIEGQAVFQTLLDSMQVEDDYEVYQAVFRVAESFPDPEFSQYLVAALPDLIKRQPEQSGWAGDFLNAMAGRPERIRTFNAQLAQADLLVRKAIVKYIRKQESKGGWLENSVGLLAPE